MSFKHLTPEQRKAAAEKSAATRRAKKAKREIENLAVVSREWDEPEIDEAAEEYFPEPELIYGETPEAETDVVEPQVDKNDPFELFLVSLDAATKEILNIDELREIYAAQVAKAFAEKKAAKKKAASEVALTAARIEAGLIPTAAREAMETARRNAELVRFTVELPPSGDQGQVPDIGLRIDQKVYLHGHTYTVTRAEYDSMRDNLYRAGEHELTFKGQNTRQRKWMLGRALGAVNRHISLNDDGSLA